MHNLCVHILLYCHEAGRYYINHFLFFLLIQGHFSLDVKKTYAFFFHNFLYAYVYIYIFVIIEDIKNKQKIKTTLKNIETNNTSYQHSY